MHNEYSWYVGRDGQQIGPITNTELLAFAESGELKGGDRVWRAGWREWKRAEEIPGLLKPPPSTTGLSPDCPPVQEHRSATEESKTNQTKAFGYTPEYPQLVGVKGWLLWFCIVLTVIQPALAVVETVQSYEQINRYPAPGFASYFQVLTIITALVCAASIWVGVSLWRRRPGAHVLARHFLLLQCAVVAAAPLLIFVYVNVPPERVDAVVTGLTPDMLKIGLSTAIWYLYLLRSKRVQANFGPP